MLIPYELQKKLLHEILPQTDSTHAQAHLCALVDLARVDDATRQDLLTRFEHRMHFLLRDEEFKEWQYFGAALIAPASSDVDIQNNLFGELKQYNSDTISAWITTTLPPADLAQHLSGATFAYEEIVSEEIDWDHYGEEQKKQVRYLLRYYDPLITPVLYGDAPQAWQQWFFAPIMSWWFAQPTAQNEHWYRIVGKGQYPHQVDTAPKLMLSEALKQALHEDTFPYKLLHHIEQSPNAKFTHDCSGVRLAQVKERIKMAQNQGFNHPRQWSDFVYLSFHYPIERITQHPDWPTIKQQSLSGANELYALVQQYIIQSHEHAR